LARRLHFGGRSAYLAGALSGLFGGMVGNQGGLRAAAMLAFDLSKPAFVATATAIALFVDGARMPVYFISQWRGIASIWIVLTIATLFVLLGTVAGGKLLTGIPERTFRRVLAAVLIALGLFMLALGR
jgi:uncharacterized membrane protein YfcA